MYITKHYIKLGYLKFIAVFMCWLIISLPVYGSSAYAITIENVKITGSDGKEGYVKPMDDTLNIEATISEPITNTEIFVDISSLGVVNDIFNSCNDKVCTYSHAISSIDSKKYSLSVKVNTESGESNSKNADFCADGLGPTVKVKAAGQDKGKLVVQFTATDKAPSNCAGLEIKDAMLFLNGEQFKAMDPPFEGDKSTEDGTFEIDKSELSEEILNDAIDVCVEVTDVLGNSGKGCKTTASKFDFTAPDILEETIIVTDENGNVIKYVAGAKEDQTDVFTKINVKVNISEENLKTTGTWGDFSKLTTKSEKKTQYEKKAPDSCTKEDTINNIYVCEWKGIEYNGKIAVLSVTFHAEDTAGNKDEIEQTLPVERYSGSPVVGRIFIVGKEDQDPIYLAGGKGYDIGVEISDPVGFNNNKKLFIKLSGFSSIPTLTNPCEETTSGVWVCYFNKMKTKNSFDGKGSIEVLSGSQNDINKIIDLETSVKILEVIIDSSAPSIVEFAEDTIFNELQYKENDEAVFGSTDCPTGESGYDLTFIVTDKNKPTIVAESGAISYNELTTGTCTEADVSDYPFVPDVDSMDLTAEQVKEKGIPLPFECTVSIQNILPVTGKDFKFDVNITDPAGNVYSHEQITNLCAEDLTKTPDFVESISIDEKETPIPTLSKKTLQLTDYPMILNLNYEFKLPGVTILSQDITCEGVSIEFMIGDRIDEKSNKGSAEIVATVLKKAISVSDPNLDWDEEGNILNDIYPVKCKASMIVRQKNKNYQLPEEEEFSFTIPLIGMIMGEASDAMIVALKKIDDDIAEQQSRWEKLEIVITILEYLCAFVEILAVINGLIQAIKMVAGNILLGIGETQVFRPAAEAVWKALCGFADPFLGFVTNWLWPPGVLPYPVFRPGFLFKYMCIYLSCKFADPSVLGELLGQLGNLFIDPAIHKQWDQGEKEGYEVSENPPLDVVTLNSDQYGYTLDKGETFVPTTYVATSADMLNLNLNLPVHFIGNIDAINNFEKNIKYNGIWYLHNVDYRDEVEDAIKNVKFDPFRMATFSDVCPRAQLYNVQKHKQILCAKKVCYLNSIKFGVNSAQCDKAEEVHNCLYIESATVHVTEGLWGEWLMAVLSSAIWMILNNLVSGWILEKTCPQFYNPSVVSALKGCKLLEFIPESTGCGIAMTVIAGMEFAYLLDNEVLEKGLDYYNSKTLKADYCGLAEQLESEVTI